MSVQPCGCDMTALDWPYAHATLDPSDDNGIKCGLDENGDSVIWSYPDHDVVHTVATKTTASGIANGTWTGFGTLTERAGASYFDGNRTFTAPIAGMYDITLQFEENPNVAIIMIGRVVSNYSAWGSPVLRARNEASDAVGGGVCVSGQLPAAAGGTFELGVWHNKSPTYEFVNIYFSCSWRSPIPT